MALKLNLSLLFVIFGITLKNQILAKEKKNQVHVVGHDPPTYSCPDGYIMQNNHMCKLITQTSMMANCSVGVAEGDNCVTYEEPHYICPVGYMPFHSNSKGKYITAQQCMKIEHASIEELCVNGSVPSSQGCISTHTIPATMSCPVSGPHKNGSKYHSGSSDCVMYETVDPEQSCNPGYSLQNGMCTGTQSYPCTYDKTKTHHTHHTHHTNNKTYHDSKGNDKKYLRVLNELEDLADQNEVTQVDEPMEAANEDATSHKVEVDGVTNIENSIDAVATESVEKKLPNLRRAQAVDNDDENEVDDDETEVDNDETEDAEDDDDDDDDAEKDDSQEVEGMYKKEEYSKDDSKKKAYTPPQMCQTTVEVQPNTYCPSGTVQTSGHMHHWHMHESHKGGYHHNHHTKDKGFSCVKATQVPLIPTCPQGVMDSSGYSCTLESYEPAVQNCPAGFEVCSANKYKYSSNQCCAVNYAPPEATCSDGSDPVNGQCKFTHPINWSCPPGTQINGTMCEHTEITPVKVQYTVHIETTEPLPVEKKEKVHHIPVHHGHHHHEHHHHSGHHSQHGHTGHHGN